MVVLRTEPETRWFRRHVLRRKARLVVVHAGVPERLRLSRRLNQPDEVSFLLADGGTP